MGIASLIIEQMAPESEEKEISDLEAYENQKQVIASDLIAAIKKADARMLSAALHAFIECIEVHESEETKEEEELEHK